MQTKSKKKRIFRTIRLTSILKWTIEKRCLAKTTMDHKDAKEEIFVISSMSKSMKSNNCLERYFSNTEMKILGKTNWRQ
jgi:hypothetical protein